MKSDGISSRVAAFLGQYGVLLVGFLITVALVTMVVRTFSNSNSLATLALAGVITLLAALLIFTTLMQAAGLSDKTQALGLPDGSVRAIIALALVGLFAVLAASVLQPARSPEITKGGLTTQQVDEFKARYPDVKDLVRTGSPEKGYTLSFTSSSPTQPLDDFAKQMVTLVGTLMTALTAFYFGGRTAASGTDVSRAAPELTGIENDNSITDGACDPTSGPLALTLIGANLNSVRTVCLIGQDARLQLEAVFVLSNPSRVNCTFAARDDFNKGGVWDVTVVDDIGRASTKAGLLTIRSAISKGQQEQKDIDSSDTPQGGLSAQKIDPVEVSTSVKDTSFIVTGTDLDKTTGVLLMSGSGSEVPTEFGQASSTQVSFKLPSAPDVPGTLGLKLKTGAGEVETKLMVTVKSP